LPSSTSRMPSATSERLSATPPHHSPNLR
jgi:hypothetical protein